MTLRVSTAATAAVAIFASAVCASAPASARTLQLDDLRKLVGVGQPAISPDGKRAVVVVSRINWNEDRNERDLEIVDLATHAHRALTFDRALRDNGKDVTFFAYPVDGHFPADPVRTLDLFGRWIDFFARRI